MGDVGDRSLSEEERRQREALKAKLAVRFSEEWEGRDIFKLEEVCQAREPCWNHTQRYTMNGMLSVRLCRDHQRLAKLVLGVPLSLETRNERICEFKGCEERQSLTLQMRGLTDAEEPYRYLLCPEHYGKIAVRAQRYDEHQLHPEVSDAVQEIVDHFKLPDRVGFFMKHGGALRRVAGALEIVTKLEASVKYQRGESTRISWERLLYFLQEGFDRSGHEHSRIGDMERMRPLCSKPETVQKCGWISRVKAGRLLTVAREQQGELAGLLDEEGIPTRIPRGVWLAFLRKEWCGVCATMFMERLREVHGFLIRQGVQEAMEYLGETDVYQVRHKRGGTLCTGRFQR